MLVDPVQETLQHLLFDKRLYWTILQLYYIDFASNSSFPLDRMRLSVQVTRNSFVRFVPKSHEKVSSISVQRNFFLNLFQYFVVRTAWNFLIKEPSESFYIREIERRESDQIFIGMNPTILFVRENFRPTISFFKRSKRLEIYSNL